MRWSTVSRELRNATTEQSVTESARLPVWASSRVSDFLHFHWQSLHRLPHLRISEFRRLVRLRVLDRSDDVPRWWRGWSTPTSITVSRERAERASMVLQTPRLNVVLQTRREVERMIEAMSERDRAEVSADWLALVRASEDVDPWVRGFRAVHRDNGIVVGSCGFKGPPTEGVVEIAYGVHPEHQ